MNYPTACYGVSAIKIQQSEEDQFNPNPGSEPIIYNISGPKSTGMSVCRLCPTHHDGQNSKYTFGFFFYNKIYLVELSGKFCWTRHSCMRERGRLVSV